nr:uncharacterized protein LOC109178468 [Ipomoea trifida]
MGDQSLADSVTAIRGDIRAIKATLEPTSKPVTNLISEHFVKGDQSLADTVTALRGDVRAIKATLEAMKSDQNELFQMFRQLMTAVPKFTALEFPRYDGSGDPVEWLHKCEQFFKAQSTQAHQFVSTAAFHLAGVAMMWHIRLESEKTELTWQQFKKLCVQRFGPLGNRSHAKLTLQDGRSIEEYNHEFKSILMRINTVSQDEEVRLYLAGLDDWLRFDLKSGPPASLGKAIGLALSVCRRCTVCPP